MLMCVLRLLLRANYITMIPAIKYILCIAFKIHIFLLIAKIFSPKYFLSNTKMSHAFYFPRCKPALCSTRVPRALLSSWLAPLELNGRVPRPFEP